MTTRLLIALEARRDDVWDYPGMHYVYAMVHGHAEPWGMTPDRLERSGYRRELDAMAEGLRKLHAAGIRILGGGDFGHQWTHHGTYAAELQRYVELLKLTPVDTIIPSPGTRLRWSGSRPVRWRRGISPTS